MYSITTKWTTVLSDLKLLNSWWCKFRSPGTGTKMW